MERKTQISIILVNTPGELAKLCEVLSESDINILAMNIQNAKDAVKELFKIREKTRRRIALAESYRSILKDSADYSIIRILVDKPEEAERKLTELEYLLDSEPVLVFTLTNKPGMLGQVAKRLGEAGININYTYGSVMEDAEKSIFILHVPDIEKVEQFFAHP
ncbi:MAG: ACT domain-containing protein [Deltaproteobacteria bacterium]|nr:ACT domain-containing protein [Deltaproteobacteria bacterium]